MSGNSNIPSIEKLKGRENYNTWRFAVKTFLEHEDLWSCVTGTDTTTEAAKKVRRDIVAKSKIVLLVDSAIYVHIQNANSAKEVWDKLESTFHDSGLTRKVSLIRSLITTNLANCESIEDYVSKIMTTAQKLNDIKFEISDEWLGTFLLAGLPEEYKPMIMAIENSGIALTADSIKTKLLQEIKGESTNTTVALYNKSRFHQKKNQPTKCRGPRCFNCNNYGHMSKDCNSKKKSSNQQNSYPNNASLLSSFSAFVGSANKTWYVDSGASAHMSHLLPENLQESTVNDITVANNQKILVQGVGSANVPLKNGPILVKKVLYVPELSTNLLSVSQTVKQGNSVLFDKRGCQIFNAEGSVIATASLVDNIYKLDCDNSDGVAGATSLAVKTEGSDLWHRRLGHLNYTYVKNLKCNAEAKMDISTKCKVCVKGKFSIFPFKNIGTRATKVLELVHSDLCGPVETASLGGARYFLTFVDDFTHKVFIYILKNKNETAKIFKIFKAYVENQTEQKIKILRSDNGGEYLSNFLKSYLEESGIQHQFTVPYTPQQNGVAERMNRTIVEKIRCMLLDSGLGKEFWAEAAATACYLINRSPTKCLPKDKTPEEMWSGKNVDLTHLKVFGCKALMHVPKQNRRKLDAKAIDCIFVGYSLVSKGYRLFDPVTKKNHIARDVVFLENEIVGPRIHQDDPFFIDLVGDTAENHVSQALNENVLEVEEIDSVFGENDESSTDFSDNASVDQNFEFPLPENNPVENIPTRRSERQKKPVKMNDFHLYSAKSSVSDPITVAEALAGPDAKSWHSAMKSEYDSLISNNTWELTDIPNNKNVIKSKWVFKTKTSAQGEVRFKARLVVKGCSQKPGIDYEETYAPVVRYNSIRYLLALSVRFDLDIDQMDAVSAFLHGDLTEEIYMVQPELFETADKVCRLRKTIYGLKQASREWNKKLNSCLLQAGLKCSQTDSCVYYSIRGEKLTFVAVYVDDLLIFSNDIVFKSHLKAKLSGNFKMKDLGEAKHCLGFEIIRDRSKSTLAINQRKYITEILQRFNMADCNPVSTPLDINQKLSKEMSPKLPDEITEMSRIPYQQAVGSLLYASQGTRPDIAFAVSLVSRFNNNPGKAHWNAVKRIFRYLKGTLGLTLIYSKDPNSDIVGYCDADWASDIDERRSATGYVFKFQGAPITWATKRQTTVALSTAEAEYMALSAATQEAVWLRNFNREFKIVPCIPTQIFCDNKSAIDLAHTSIHHSRSKHIDIRHHFVREKVFSKEIVLKSVSTEDNDADVFTKGLAYAKHHKCLSDMGLTGWEK